MLERLRRDPADHVRASAARQLGTRKAREAVPALVEVVVARTNKKLDNDEYELGGSAIQALGELGDPVALEPLRAALEVAIEKGDLSGLYLAAVALGLLGERESIPWLRHAIRFPVSVVCGPGGCVCPERYYAARALGRLGEAGATELLEVLDGDEAPENAAEALGETRSPRAFARLIALLGERSRRMRASAAIGLGRLGDTRAIDHVLPLVDSPDPSVVEAAAWSVQRLSGHDVGAAAEPRGGPGPGPGRTEALRRAVKEWAAARSR